MILGIVVFNVLVIGILGGVAVHVAGCLREARQRYPIHRPEPVVLRWAPTAGRRRAS